MLYLCLAMVVDVAIFTMGLTMSIIDVNRYNFGLYLVLMSVVTFSLLVALWVAKPKFCRTPTWAINVYHSAVKSSRPNYQTAGEMEVLVEPHNADEIMRSIKGIPLLIQAIQYSLEAAYIDSGDSTTGIPTVTDSAIESSVTTRDYYPQHHATSTERSQSSSIPGPVDEVTDSNENVRQDGTRGSEHRIQSLPRRRIADMKRQSIFVVFPYSDTVPIDQSKLRMRRSSSEHDLGAAFHGKRKSSFERFCAAAIAGQNRYPSTALTHSAHIQVQNHDHQHRIQNATGMDERSHSFSMDRAEEGHDQEASLLKADSTKKIEARRPSLEVRYVGLQSILLAKMGAKQRQDSS